MNVTNRVLILAEDGAQNLTAFMRLLAPVSDFPLKKN